MSDRIEEGWAVCVKISDELPELLILRQGSCEVFILCVLPIDQEPMGGGFLLFSESLSTSELRCEPL